MSKLALTAAQPDVAVPHNKQNETLRMLLTGISKDAQVNPGVQAISDKLPKLSDKTKEFLKKANPDGQMMTEDETLLKLKGLPLTSVAMLKGHPGDVVAKKPKFSS